MSHIFLQVLNFALYGLIVNLSVFEIGNEGLVVSSDTRGNFLEPDFFVEQLFIISQKTGKVIFKSFNIDEPLVELVSQSIFVSFQVIDLKISFPNLSSESIDLIF